MSEERVLLLIPHPDDEVVGTATAIGRLRRRGGELFGLYLTTGVPPSAGSWFGGRFRYPRRVARRWDEASAVASSLGISIAGRQMIPARNLKSHLDSTLRWIRERAISLEVDQIWVPAYEGGHQDHDVTSFLGSRLGSEYQVLEFAEYNFSGGKVRSQSFPEANGEESTILLTPEERSRKLELLGRYASEAMNLRGVGVECEVNRPLPTYDYSSRPHSGRLFYERFHWVPYHPRIDYCRSEQVCNAIRDAA